MPTVEDANKTAAPAGVHGAAVEVDEDAEQLYDLLEEFYAFMYEKAVLVGPAGTSPSKMKSPSKIKSGTTGSPTRGSSPTHEALRKQASGPSAANVPVSTREVSIPAAALSREIMDAVLPPKTWQNTHGKWQRMVSMMPATRTDTQKLQETFDQLLEQYQARVHAICPVREKFFLQVFEELIREVTCECPERGLMLLRVRDELRLTIEAHQTLYHNSIAYGRQKAVQAEAGVGKLDKQISRLQAERDLLEAKKKQLAQKIMCLEEKINEEEKRRQLRHAHTVQFLQTQLQELEVFHREMTQDATWK
ncbi:33 kDa inner dynein arm light chain, axonemal [Phytophthora cinnamomi]|uniref:33 kDa inner dynein arm light chain, axonemal n=1 Tax=Phytophthora cinnamomi TaxID=4785 RepID=UPI00355A81C9|nr:33 kDa inner dynein arm light chain, axonemal [Phytophthora cinnamomi]